MMNQNRETPKEAARRLAAKAIMDGFEPEALHVYSDHTGLPLHWCIRLKHPETGIKWIRPMMFDGSNYVLGEPTYEGGKPLYRLHELAQRVDETVIVTEGEFKADLLAAKGLVVTTSGSASSAESADWGPLASRDVMIWPDNDDAGMRYARTVASLLRKLDCTVRVVNVAALGLALKGDAADWLAANPAATAANVTALACNPTSEGDGNAVDAPSDAAETNVGNVNSAAGRAGSDNEEEKSQATAMVEFVEDHCVLFHDENLDVYAQDRSSNETRRVDGRQFRDWLVSSFYTAVGKSPRDQSVREALTTLGGLSRFRGECMPVHVRAAHHQAAYFLDLGAAGSSNVVKIERGRWTIEADPPVRFLRPEALRALPVPKHGGDVSVLWGFVNVPVEARLLVLAWLCECLRPNTPFPVLELIGEQGSAKSTTQAMLRRLIDPNACDLRAAPKSVEDIFVSASANWLASYENISHMSSAMQDALCVLATGGGFAKRKLYTDADESVIVVKRPTILNGIGAAVTAQDLIDRTLSVELPVIKQRQEVTDLWNSYERVHDEMLGGLLDVMVAALELLPTIQLPPGDQPRLVEFARFGMAIAQACGHDPKDFLTQFNASRQESIARTIDASPAASALMQWFEVRGRGASEMSASDLFREVSNYKPMNTDAWPRSAKGFADALRRAAPALRQLGIECRSTGKVGGSIRWRVEARANT